MDVCAPVLALASADTDLARPMLAIGFVLGLLFLMLFLVRRMAAKGSTASLAATLHAFPGTLLKRNSRSEATREFSIIGQLTLTPTHRLHVLSLRGRDVVVVTHPQGCEWFALDSLDTAAFSGVLKETHAG